MSFYGKDPEPKQTPERKTFHFIDDNGQDGDVKAHAVYFYESGHVGFWDNRTEGTAGTLVLAIRASQIWEEGDDDA